MNITTPVQDSALSVRQASFTFAVAGHGKVECRSGKTGNLPGGLVAPATIMFSVFTRDRSAYRELLQILQINPVYYILQINIHFIANKPWLMLYEKQKKI